MPRGLWIALLIVMCGGCGPNAESGADAGPRADAGDNGAVSFTEERLGSPLWKIVGWQHYPAPLGSEADRAPFEATLASVWEDHRVDEATGVVAPDRIHSPPYDDEVETGVDRAGFDSGNLFTMSSWEEPSGLVLSAVIVPDEGAPEGRSTDFTSSPIIPETIFPILIDVELYLDNAPLDPALDFSYPTIDSVEPGADADGWSHMPLNLAENTAFIDGAPGNYRYSVTVTDANGDGWRVSLPFSVAP